MYKYAIKVIGWIFSQKKSQIPRKKKVADNKCCVRDSYSYILLPSVYPLGICSVITIG